jgi:Putative Ig domain
MSPDSPRRAAALAASRTEASISIVALALLVCVLVSQNPCAQAQDAVMRSRRHHHLTVSATLAPATIGVAYNAVISVSGGTAPYTFDSQNLPSSLVLNHHTGGISGTPNSTGQFALTVRVADNAGTHGMGNFTLTVNNKGGIGVTISPTNATVNSGGKSQFQATVSNTSNTAVTWTASAGIVSSSGLFTAPTVTKNTSVVLTATSVADSTKSATANISVVTAAAGKVALEVLFPPTHPHQPYYNDVQTYLMHNPLVSGANLVVEWSSIDNGPGASQYDWSALDSAVLEWTSVGKKVNLIIWTISDSPTNTATPQYIWHNLGAAHYTTCNGQQIPDYFSPAYQIPYQQFMTQVVQHYGNNPGIGYIRFGLGRGGETNPARGLGKEAACTNAFMNQWGWTETAWINYLNSMLNYEASLKSPKQLMVGLVGTNLIKNAPAAAAATAVAAHIGFGSQGLEARDIASYPNCTSDWCNLFNQYNGQVPLELQTVAQSDPSGAGLTGSLVPLIPFAIGHHANVFEIYWQDWLLAFDPAYPGYALYGPAYAKVLTQAANSPIQ